MLFLLVAVVTLIAAPWDEFTVGLVLLILAGTLLVVGLVIHGLWDFASFIGNGRGDDGTGLPAGAYAVPFLWGALGMSIALAIVVFRRGRGRDRDAA